MRSKSISLAAVTDLGTEAPFLPNYTAVVLNPSAAANTIEFSDSATGPFTAGRKPDGSVADIPAYGAVEVVISGRYAASRTGLTGLQILGN